MTVCYTLVKGGASVLHLGEARRSGPGRAAWEAGVICHLLWARAWGPRLLRIGASAARAARDHQMGIPKARGLGHGGTART